jgi:hypothetical protein
MPTKQILREYGEGRLSYELRRFTVILLDQYPTSVLTQRLVDRLNDPLASLVFTVEFCGGFVDGGGERLRAWRDDLQSVLTAILKFIKNDGAFEVAVAIDLSLYEFFRGAFSPIRPRGLSPEVEHALERLELVRGLREPMAMLAMLDDASRAQGFVEMLELTGEDIMISAIEEGSNWIFRFLAAEPQEQGRLLGRLIGEALIELARAFIEPPELDLVELAGNLQMTSDEVASLVGTTAQ